MAVSNLITLPEYAKGFANEEKGLHGTIARCLASTEAIVSIESNVPSALKVISFSVCIVSLYRSLLIRVITI